jgi:hypothetical protein
MAGCHELVPSKVERFCLVGVSGMVYLPLAALAEFGPAAFLGRMTGVDFPQLVEYGGSQRGAGC